MRTYATGSLDVGRDKRALCTRSRQLENAGNDLRSYADPHGIEPEKMRWLNGFVARLKHEPASAAIFNAPCSCLRGFPR